jgi:hypothetical protein
MQAELGQGCNNGLQQQTTAGTCLDEAWLTWPSSGSSTTVPLQQNSAIAKQEVG